MLFASFFAFSQTGKVGVNTETPTETLDINGTLRVQNLPSEGDDISTADDGSEGTNTFVPERGLSVDKNGVVGIMTSNPPEIQTKCVKGNTSYNMNGRPSLVFDMGYFSVKWNNYNGNLALGNNIQLKNNNTTVEYVYMTEFGGDALVPYALANGAAFDPNVWKDAFRPINWDTEESGEGVVYFENSTDYYRLTYWTHKRTAASVPVVCMSVQYFSGAEIVE